MATRVQEFRDLISGVRDGIGSLRSAVGYFERDAEARRLIRLHEELSATVCERATPRDKQRAATIIEDARRLACAVLMEVHDNEAVAYGMSDLH